MVIFQINLTPNLMYFDRNGNEGSVNYSNGNAGSSKISMAMRDELKFPMALRELAHTDGSLTISRTAAVVDVRNQNS